MTKITWKRHLFFVIPCLLVFGQSGSSAPQDCSGNGCAIVSQEECKPKFCLLSDTVNTAIRSIADNPPEDSAFISDQGSVILDSSPSVKNPSPGLSMMFWGPPGGTPATVNSSGMQGEFGF